MIEHACDDAFAAPARYVEDGKVPCATLGLVDSYGNMAVRFVGNAAIDPEREPLTRDHWFDLASVTKVIATTTMVLKLAEQGLIDLDRPLTDAIPDLRQYDIAHAPERRLTFRDCLAHRSFFPAVFPIYTYGNDPDTLRAFVLQRAWEIGPPVYSDINFILLGIAIERITGKPLDAWPIGDGLSYGPPPGPAVPTERCSWRGRICRGEVHDENAFAMGGATGHAGLFGTIDGVLGFARDLMQGKVLAPDSMAAIREPLDHSRTCGWEAAFGGWPGGEACSRQTIGHTGFTGTGLWIDFERGLAWSLLTNRVHPTRHGTMHIKPMRRETSDAVISAWDRHAGAKQRS